MWQGNPSNKMSATDLRELHVRTTYCIGVTEYLEEDLCWVVIILAILKQSYIEEEDPYAAGLRRELGLRMGDGIRF